MVSLRSGSYSHAPQQRTQHRTECRANCPHSSDGRARDWCRARHAQLPRTVSSDCWLARCHPRGDRPGGAYNRRASVLSRVGTFVALAEPMVRADCECLPTGQVRARASRRERNPSA